jgi:hypothetical protein
MEKTMTVDALETLGTIIDEHAGRDAIHVAVEPVKARHILMPGQRITIGGDTAYADPNGIGIVDPFLPFPVQTGQWFWMLLMPRTITSLRHVWKHPFFDKQEENKDKFRRAEAENWMRNYLESHNDNPGFDLIYKAVMEGGSTTIPDGDYDHTGLRIEGEYLHVSGRDAHGEIDPKFWDMMEILTGRKMTKRPTHFSCGC